MSEQKLYADRNPMELEPNYCAHVMAMTAEQLHWKSDIAAELAFRDKEIERLRAELEIERMRLAACGVVALADTPESAKSARDMADEYRSASCGDVARRVDECMSLRAEVERLKAAAVPEDAK